MSSATSWQRLPAVTLVYFALRSIPQLINLWPAVLGAWAAGSAARDLLLEHGLLLLLTLILLGSLLPYWFFRYQIAQDHIQLRSGVLKRKRLTLYFDRVQQADISQPFYFRPFGLATLGLESAGSSQQEVDIPGLPLAEAEELKAKILSYQHQQLRDQSPATPKPPGEQVPPNYELRLPWHEVARYGLMRNGLVFLMPLLAPLLERQLPIVERWLASLEKSDLHQALLALANGNPTLVFIVLSTLSIIGGLIVIYTTSAAIALIRWWGYHLIRVGEQYQYRAGFFTVRTRGFRLHKLQLITLTQGVVARLLNRYTLTMSKAGGSGSQVQDEQRFLIPVVSPAALKALKQQMALTRPRWQRVSRFYIFWRSLVMGSIFASLVAALLAVNNLHISLSLLLYPVTGIIIWRRWSCMGYFQDEQWLALRSGFIGRKARWLPIVKAQKFTLSQPPWLRFLGLCNLYVWSADGILSIPCVSHDAALALRGRTLNLVTRYRGRWI